MKNLSVEELVKFHFVFDSIELDKEYSDIYEAIKFEIFHKLELHKARFCFESAHLTEIKNALIKFAKSDRKKLGISKIMPRFRAQKVVNELIEANFLSLEKSLQNRPEPKRKNEKLPKELRRYVVCDKVHFTNNFSRFWFRFIEPNIELLQNGKFDNVLGMIKKDFDNYASLGFEILSIELLAKFLNLDKGLFSSFWDKYRELDIYAQIDDGYIIVGECKYKERKVCKNILNLTLHKCKNIGIEPQIVALFSKSGFSSELLHQKNDHILLFDIEQFELLLH